jgi:flagellar basal body L-ring protein FlgH
VSSRASTEGDIVLMLVHLLDRAASKARDIRDLERDRDSGKFGVTINGRYQDEAMLAAADAAIKGVLQARIDAAKAELREMGVEID